MGCEIRILVVAAVALVIASIVFYSEYLRQHDVCMYGLWNIDSNFAKDDDLDSFLIYFSPPGDDMNAAACGNCKLWFLLKAGGQTRANKPVCATIARRIKAPNGIQKYDLHLAEEVDIIPRDLTLEHDVASAMLTLSKDDKLYGRFFKATEASFYCQIDLLGDESGAKNKFYDKSGKDDKSNDESDDE